MTQLATLHRQLAEAVAERDEARNELADSRAAHRLTESALAIVTAERNRLRLLVPGSRYTEQCRAFDARQVAELEAARERDASWDEVTVVDRHTERDLEPLTMAQLVGMEAP